MRVHYQRTLMRASYELWKEINEQRESLEKLVEFLDLSKDRFPLISYATDLGADYSFLLTGELQR